MATAACRHACTSSVQATSRRDPPPIKPRCRLYGKPFSLLIRNFRYLKLIADICNLIGDIRNLFQISEIKGVIHLPKPVSVSILKLVLVYCYKWIGRFAKWFWSIFNMLIYGFNYAVALATNNVFICVYAVCCIRVVLTVLFCIMYVMYDCKLSVVWLVIWMLGTPYCQRTLRTTRKGRVVAILYPEVFAMNN